MREVWYPRNRAKHIALVHKNRKKLREERQVFVDALKEGPCKDCGNKFHPCAMDFDHVRGQKISTIAEAGMKLWSEKKILAEIATCELVCANCHRIRTHIRRKVIAGLRSGLPRLSHKQQHVSSNLTPATNSVVM